MLRLHLLRHAKTEQFSPSGNDFDRYLMEKGTRQCDALVDHFSGISGIKNVWCSDATRTRQTLEPLSILGLPKAEYSKDLYLCSYKAILERIWKHTDAGDLLIVGHNFGISDLASYFADERIELRTAGYVRIGFEVDSWKETSRGNGIIEELYRPEV